jgi:hypothetical protein
MAIDPCVGSPILAIDYSGVCFSNVPLSSRHPVIVAGIETHAGLCRLLGPVTTWLCKMAKVDQYPAQQPQTFDGTRLLSKVTGPNPGIPRFGAGAKGGVRSAKCKKRTLLMLVPPSAGRYKVVAVQYVMVGLAILHSFVVTGPYPAVPNSKVSGMNVLVSGVTVSRMQCALPRCVQGHRNHLAGMPSVTSRLRGPHAADVPS